MPTIQQLKEAFDNYSDDNGLLKWSNLQKVLSGAHMKITKNELEALNMRLDNMDFKSFHATIKEGKG